jgi:hypothetical protein
MLVVYLVVAYFSVWAQIRGWFEARRLARQEHAA